MSESSIEVAEALPAPIWEATAKRIDGILQNQLREVEIDSDEVGRVASIGCGTFYEAGSLARSFPNAEIVGIDRDSSILKMASRFPTFPHEAKLVLQDLSEDGQRLEGEYGVIVLRNPDIHRFANWQKVVPKCIDGLKDGGIMLITNHTEEEADQLKGLLSGLDIKVDEALEALPHGALNSATDNHVIIAQKSQKAA